MSSIVGIDTATADTAVAVCPAGAGPEPEAEELIGPEPGGRPRHAAALLGAVERTVAESGGWELVERIAVGIGPGSFTGIRIGVATARALAQARALPLAAIETTAALAAGIDAGPERPRVAVIDARRGEVFAALLAVGAEEARRPLLARPEQVAGALGTPEAAIAAGDGAVRFRRELESSGFEVPADQDPSHRLSARHICALGHRAPGGSPEATRPLYLRRPDAERWRERDDQP